MCSELKALELAYFDTSSQFDDANGLMMGDFNAACRYQHRNQYGFLSFRSVAIIWLNEDVCRATACMLKYEERFYG